MTSGPKDAATSDSTSWPRADSPRSTPTPRKRGHDTRRTHRIECNNRSPGDVFIHHHPGLGPARSLGHEYIVATDHSPNLTIANGLSTERLMRQLEEIEGSTINLPLKQKPERHHFGFSAASRWTSTRTELSIRPPRCSPDSTSS